jgi:hypothetical protein
VHLEVQGKPSEGVHVLVKSDQVLQLDAVVTLFRAEFNDTYKEAISALLGVPGLSITPEWCGFEDPGTCRVSLTLHETVYEHAGVLRDLAATGGTGSANAVKLNIHPWKLLQVLAMSSGGILEWLLPANHHSPEQIDRCGVLLSVRNPTSACVREHSIHLLHVSRCPSALIIKQS